MTNPRPDDGDISDIPWASVFDPAVNVRALGEIQARGFRAASDLVDRFVRMGTRNSAGTNAAPSRSEPQPDHSGGQPAIPDAERVLAAWQKMIGQVMHSLRGATSPHAGVAAFDFMNATATGHIFLETAERGPVSTEVWLHNGGAEDLGKVRLRCSDLLAHDGTLVDSAMVRFEPDPVPMVARSSRGVTMEIDVAEEIRPGSYRGTLLADGHPDVWLLVVLNVLPPAS